ncbi:MAG: hypothetical protein GY852_04285 [bacterium]|nr:hypothetical protein [bacterium]
MENIAKLMERANAEYYAERGKHIYADFKTFAGCRKLGKACAVEFLERAQKAEGELRVYEIGVGDGRFALNFLQGLRQMDSTVAKNVVYVLWDMSGKLLDEAEGKLGDFAIEKVNAGAEEVGEMRDAFWVRGNEILDDIPARVFLRKGEKVYEVGKNNLEFCAEEKTVVPAGVQEYMEGMPEEHWVPLNLRAAKLVGGWKEKLRAGGGISMLDYGFLEVEGPAEIWNGSVVRKYGGEYTVDVNFDFLMKTMGGDLETQDEFVRNGLGEKVFAVEKGEGMKYMDDGEIEKERKRIEEEGYDIELLKRGKEKNPYFHYFISV